MKFQHYIIESDSLLFVNFADLHWGHKNVDKPMIHRIIKFINDNNCYWLGGGDYGDAIIPNDKRFDYRSIDEEYKTPDEQYDKIEELFQPIANKCLGLLDGNHDIIHWKKHGHNYVKRDLAKTLKVPYLTVSAYLRLHFKQNNADFNIYAHHGWTGARTAGGRINRIHDLFFTYPMLDLYIMNHIHALGLADKKTSLYIGPDRKIHDKISYFLFGGSFLRGYVLDQVSYVEEKTYVPSTLGSPVLRITPYKGKSGINFTIEYKEIR